MRAAEQIIGFLGGASRPAWVQPGALGETDFFNNRAWPLPAASAWNDAHASVQYVQNASGLFTQVAPTILPVSSSYLACEVSRANQALQSQTFDTGWTTSQASVVADSTVAPDGTTTADSIREDGSNNIHQIIQSETLTVGTNALSFYVKPVTRSWCFIDMFQNTGSVDHSAYFNLSGAGSVGTVAGLLSSSILAFANGFYKCTVVGTLTNAAVTTVIGGATADTVRSYTGTALATAFALWQAQGELGSNSSSPIPTIATPATRAANAPTLYRTGVQRAIFTFDDDSTQTVSGISPATNYVVDPSVLNRPLIKDIAWFAS